MTNKIEIGARFVDTVGGGEWVHEDGSLAETLDTGLGAERVRHGHVLLSIGNRYEGQSIVLRDADIERLRRFLAGEKTRK